MRTIEKIVYLFSELSEDAKQKAVENLYDINVDFEWWDGVYDNANEIGLKLTTFDIDRNRHCNGEFITSAGEVVEAILNSHGEMCETYKTALKYKDAFLLPSDEVEDVEDLEDAENEFLNDILEDYSIMLQKEYEYLTSEEAIIETIEANEYEFTEDGKLYR